MYIRPIVLNLHVVKRFKSMHSNSVYTAWRPETITCDLPTIEIDASAVTNINAAVMKRFPVCGWTSRSRRVTDDNNDVKHIANVRRITSLQIQRAPASLPKCLVMDVCIRCYCTDVHGLVQQLQQAIVCCSILPNWRRRQMGFRIRTCSCFGDVDRSLPEALH